MSAKIESILTHTNVPGFKSPRGLKLQDKLNLAVSTDGSIYGDNIWKFHGEFQQNNVKTSAKEMRWNFKVGDASFLDMRYDELRESSKDFICSLRLRPSKRGGTLKASTLLRLFTELKALIYWMDSKNIPSYAFLTPTLVSEYESYVKTTQRNGKLISKGSIQKRLELVEKLWEQRSHITNPIDFHPFPNGGSYISSGLTREYQKNNKFDHIPDEVAIDLVEQAISYVQNKSEKIVPAYLAGKKAFDAAIEIGRSKVVAQRREREAVQDYGYDKVAPLTNEVINLRTACYITIAFFSGIRDSELASLDLNCIETDEDDGYIWLHGKVYKTAHNVNDVRWMVPPIVKDAVCVLERLSGWLRESLQKQIKSSESDLHADVIGSKKQHSIQKDLDRMKLVNKRLFLVKSSKGGNSIDVNKTIHAQLKDFIEAQGVVKYLGETWNLHPHQFRRTFVRFMVKNAMNIRYLQDHFKHISLDMTAWYDVDDVELVNEIAEFHKEFTGQKLRSFLDSEQLAGAGGESIESQRRDYFAGIMVADREQILESMAETVTLRSTGVSWCLGDVEVGECSGVHGCMIDPSNINECSQAIVTPEFLPAWEDMERKNQELLERDDLGTHQKKAISTFLQGVINPTLSKLRSASNA